MSCIVEQQIIKSLKFCNISLSRKHFFKHRYNTFVIKTAYRGGISYIVGSVLLYRRYETCSPVADENAKIFEVVKAPHTC